MAPMTLLDLGRVAAGCETDIAHETLRAVAVAHYGGSLFGWEDAPAGAAPGEWGPLLKGGRDYCPGPRLAGVPL